MKSIIILLAFVVLESMVQASTCDIITYGKLSLEQKIETEIDRQKFPDINREECISHLRKRHAELLECALKYEGRIEQVEMDYWKDDLNVSTDLWVGAFCH